VHFMIWKPTILFLVHCTICYGQTNMTNVNFPRLILTESDTIVRMFSETIQASSAMVYAVGINDSLVLTEGQFKFAAETSSTPKSNRANLVKLFVDVSNSNFHSHFLSKIDMTPPPPPIGLDILDSVYVDFIGRYDYVLNKIGDSLLNDFAQLNEKRQKTHSWSYPFLVYNSSKNNVIFENPIEGNIYVILEALDRDGNWKPIEFWEQHQFLCGTGHRNYSLPAKTFLIGAFKRYRGNYRTKMRLKLNNFGEVMYSNVFEDTINYSQFDTTEVLKGVRNMYSDRNEEYIQKKINTSFLD